MPNPYPLSAIAESRRHDPYKNFKFRVKWGGRIVAGVNSVSALTRTTETVNNREGNDPVTPRIMPTTSTFGEITLERGVTLDEEFEKWANLVYDTTGEGAPISLKEFRKNVTIELLDEEGNPAKAYNVFGCWVSEYQALPDLDANDNSVAIERLVLQNEGWQRDPDVRPPEE